ncbi:MAG: AI-2E family transporter [Lachnospiraceae bacterium]|nr:AI-2E family transporter [Lachnospiraceae bacterium]
MELKWKSCRRAGVTIFILWLVLHYWSSFTSIAGVALGAALPLLLGCVIAYIVNILMSFFESHLFARIQKPTVQKMKRPLSMLLSFLSILLIAFLVIRMIVPELVSCVQILFEEVPEALKNLFQWLEDEFHISTFFQDESNPFQNSELDWKEILTRAINFLFTGVGGAVSAAVDIVSTVFSTAVTFLVAFIFCIYLLAGKEKIGRQFHLLMHRYLPKKAMNNVLYVLRTVDHSFHSFIVGQCIEAVILGMLCMVGMLILRIPYASMIGCLIGFTALIPVAGAYIGGALGAFMIFTVSPIKAIVFVVFLVILQQLEGNLIYPRVVGSSIGLPGIWVLAAVTIGGGVLGIGGMLLGVPLAAAIYQLLKNNVYTRLPQDQEGQEE